MDTYHAYDAVDGARANFASGLRDLLAGASMWRTWMVLGWRDFRHQTSRTLLGPLWSVVGLAITVAALGYVYGALLSWSPRDGFPFTAAGLICWFFISGCLQGGTNVFINAAGVLKERPLPISFNVYRYTWRLFIEFCLKFFVFGAVALLVMFNPGVDVLYVLPGLLLYFLNGLWVNILFGVIGARYRDAGQLMSPLMLIAFLATPILWPQTALGDRAFIGAVNPFTHFIDIIREPLLGSPPPTLSVVVVCAVLLVGWSITLVAFARCKDRIVFWL